MAILVSDTSVLIDLERGSLLEALFQLPYQFVVPDLLYERELVGPFGEALKSLGLVVEELTPDEVSRATLVRRERATLSAPDTFAFALAEARTWALLTGDGELRNLATAEGVEFHGVLWLIDQFEAEATIAVEDLHAALTAISSHPRCRLPKAEIKKRLNRLAPGG